MAQKAHTFGKYILLLLLTLLPTCDEFILKLLILKRELDEDVDADAEEVAHLSVLHLLLLLLLLLLQLPVLLSGGVVCSCLHVNL